MLNIVKPDDETAEELAQEILIWLARHLDLMERFLKLSGLQADDVRSMVGERKFYSGLLGFLMNHEPTLMDFCCETNNTPQWVSACHRHFGGPQMWQVGE